MRSTRLKRFGRLRAQTPAATAQAPFALPDLLAMRRPEASTTIAVLVYNGVTTTEIDEPVRRLAVGLAADVLHVGLTNKSVVGVEPVRTVPVTITVDECPVVDVVVVPGGLGWRRVAQDDGAMSWLIQATNDAGGVLAISTGSLILASAGRLAGHDATGHWLARQALADLGANVSTDRTVRSDDSRLITTSGARAAIDACDDFATRLRWGP